MNLFLVGYRGSGKTTVARLLAPLLGWQALDADEELERRAGRTIQQIFAESGEPTFRDLETAIVAEFAGRDRQVFSLGGGVVLREQNRQAIRQGGKAIWLRAAPATLRARIEADATTAARRPNLTAAGGLAEIEHLLAVRAPLYQALADYIVDADGRRPEAIAEEIAGWFRERLKAEG
jgi:shikimate kinase